MNTRYIKVNDHGFIEVVNW